MSDTNKTFNGVNENILSVIAYLGIFITGFGVLILERDNKKVRFNAMQSVVLFGILSVLKWILSLLPLFGGIFELIIGLVFIVCYVYLIYMAYRGIEVKVPLIGDAVHSYIYK